MDAAARIAQLEAELRERDRALTRAMERQTATAEVLRIIASAPRDLSRVLEALAYSVARLCQVPNVLVWQVDGGVLRVIRHVGELGARVAVMRAFLPISRTSVVGRAIVDRATVHVTDYTTAVETEFPDSRPSAEAGQRAGLAVPLVRGGTAIGALTVAREESGPFPPDEIALVETFADQALIAIENARLFEELEERNRELCETLEQQTATAEVLRVIASSPTNVPRVLDAICEAAARLCRAESTFIQQPRDGYLVATASAGDFATSVIAAQERGEYRGSPIRRMSFSGRAFLDRRTIHIPDVAAAVQDEYPGTREAYHVFRHRAALHVPLLRGDETLGVLAVPRREHRPFSDAEIALVEAFADQAVIAIENARLFQELQDNTQKLEVISKHKSDFLANMSHELRTPLNAILSYSQLLREEAADAGQADYIPDLEKIHGAGQHLLSLINDVLDLSRIEAGKMDLYLEPFAVADLVRDVATVARPLIEKNGNALVADCPGDVGRMHADQTKVRQVLLNLLSNAAKFTEQGTVTLTVRREDDCLAFAVADTGIGMTGEQLGRLFEAFSQVEASTRSKYGGTGLGLAISRHFCRLMGGDLTVTSIYGQGTTFAAQLPAVVSEPVS